MKKIIILLVIVLLGVGAYFGYYGMQRRLINMELAADLEASESYRQATNKSKLGALIKEQLLELSKQEDDQLRKIAQSSKTLKAYEHQKELLLDQLARENKAQKVLERAKMRAVQKK